MNAGRFVGYFALQRPAAGEAEEWESLRRASERFDSPAQRVALAREWEGLPSLPARRGRGQTGSFSSQPSTVGSRSSMVCSTTETHCAWGWATQRLMTRRPLLRSCSLRTANGACRARSGFSATLSRSPGIPGHPCSAPSLRAAHAGSITARRSGRSGSPITRSSSSTRSDRAAIAPISRASAQGFFSGHRTPFERVFRLRPGYALRADRAGVSELRWWQVPRPEKLRYDHAPRYRAQLRRTLQAAVGRRMHGHQRVCISLSAGIDSGAVAVCAGEIAKQTGVDLLALTFSTPEDPLADEAPAARQAAARLGIRHQAVTVDEDPHPLDGLLEMASRLPFPTGHVIFAVRSPPWRAPRPSGAPRCSLTDPAENCIGNVRVSADAAPCPPLYAPAWRGRALARVRLPVAEANARCRGGSAGHDDTGSPRNQEALASRGASAPTGRPVHSSDAVRAGTLPHPGGDRTFRSIRHSMPPTA